MMFIVISENCRPLANYGRVEYLQYMKLSKLAGDAIVQQSCLFLQIPVL